MNKVLIFIALAVVLAGCSPAAPTSEPINTPTEAPADETAIPEIAIEAADFSFTAPETINAGWIRVKLTNNGKEAHHVQFLRLNDDVTLEAFQEALQKGPGAEMTLSKLMGGVGQIAPTLSAQAVLNLTAGEYVIVCFVPSGDEHVPHLAKGMIKPLTVTVLEAGATAATEPTAELTVTMKDYLIDFPETLPAGPRIIKVINNGPDVHELNLLRLEDGKTAEDVSQYLAAPKGPPPFVPIGGINGMEPGASGYVELDLEPGTYVAICYIPTPKSEGHPHFTRGMIKEFTVQ